jgi:hypothetical protein
MNEKTMETFYKLMETINKYNDIALMIEEQNKSLADISERLDKIKEAQK